MRDRSEHVVAWQRARHTRTAHSSHFPHTLHALTARPCTPRVDFSVAAPTRRSLLTRAGSGLPIALRRDCPYTRLMASAAARLALPTPDLIVMDAQPGEFWFGAWHNVNVAVWIQG